MLLVLMPMSSSDSESVSSPLRTRASQGISPCMSRRTNTSSVLLPMRLDPSFICSRFFCIDFDRLFLPARYTSTVRSDAAYWLMFNFPLFFTSIKISSSLEQAVKLIIVPTVRMLMSIVLTRFFIVAIVILFLLFLNFPFWLTPLSRSSGKAQMSFRHCKIMKYFI